jgi:hypothetical protein
MTTISALTDNLTAPALVLGLLLIVIFLPRFLRKKTAASDKSSARPSSAGVIGARGQIEDMIVKLDDIGRETYARLDTKIRILNRLIEEADEKIRALQALNAAAPAPETKARPAEPKPAKPANGPAKPASAEKEKYTDVYALADAGQSVLSIARQTGMQPGEIALLLELRRTKNKDRQQ